MHAQAQSHRWSQGTPDWPVACIAGLVAGAVMMVLELVWSAVLNDVSPWHTSRLVAAIMLGPQVLQGSGFDFAVVSVALLTHYVLGLVFGICMAYVIAGFHYESSAAMMEVIGAAAGVVVYFVNFHAMSTVFPWMSELRGWGTFIAHLIFGISAASTYWRLALYRTPH
ncbi:hypothetical protein PFX98_09340 [Paucibacter sediminis]|uniref:Sodium:proline symporter n=1 Tax=Paucibacter sediminis TaxID=3019553 RepID=A0AA95SPI8_9BURK|nr:hypothetical protein [Paucibacter sp. S2-9]WIT13807.1 hypothetical protein PFX98_09340 [Paucibacter sp. S2-9]